MSHPLLLEINARCWVSELAAQLARQATLADAPPATLDHWQSLGITHIWLMGVWPTGPRSRMLALADPGLRRAYDEALPGWGEEDVAGSPYAISGYEVSPALGGERALKQLRRQLHDRGMKLVLDFIPNHTGLDHPWLAEHPEYFVQSEQRPAGGFALPTERESRWIAHGRDPYFPPWTDTAQLDYRRADTRRAMTAELAGVARLCDGVRCDMAMLVLSDIFASTWAGFPGGPAPSDEFWGAAISATRRRNPDFLFLAEAYWNTGPRLRALGFDYVYDKTLLDLICDRDPRAVQAHLLDRPAGEVEGSAHFLENHDEPRIAGRLNPTEHRAAALLTLGLPGLRLLQEGQRDGVTLRPPVQLARRQTLQPVTAIAACYDELLTAFRHTPIGTGVAALPRPRPAWEGNHSHQNLIAVLWQTEPPEFHLLVVNLAPHRAQAYVPLPVPRLTEFDWWLRDRVGTEVWERVGADLERQGLFLDVAAHAAQVFHFVPFQ